VARRFVRGLFTSATEAELSWVAVPREERAFVFFFFLVLVEEAAIVLQMWGFNWNEARISVVRVSEAKCSDISCSKSNRTDSSAGADFIRGVIGMASQVSP
jgi:hypothetical protein